MFRGPFILPPHSLFRPKSVRLHRYTFLCVYLFRWMGTREKTANEKDVRSSIYCQTNTQKQNSKMFFLFLKLILETKSPRHVPPTTVVLTAHARKFQKWTENSSSIHCCRAFFVFVLFWLANCWFWKSESCEKKERPFFCVSQCCPVIFRCVRTFS